MNEFATSYKYINDILQHNHDLTNNEINALITAQKALLLVELLGLSLHEEAQVTI